eukprot:Awhi_evm1s8637
MSMSPKFFCTLVLQGLLFSNAYSEQIGSSPDRPDPTYAVSHRPDSDSEPPIAIDTEPSRPEPTIAIDRRNNHDYDHYSHPCVLKPNIDGAFQPLCDAANSESACAGTQYCYWIKQIIEPLSTNNCLLKPSINSLYAPLCDNAHSRDMCQNEYCVWVKDLLEGPESFFTCVPTTENSGFHDICKLQAFNKANCEAYPQCNYIINPNLLQYSELVLNIENEDLEENVDDIIVVEVDVNDNENYSDGACHPYGDVSDEQKSFCHSVKFDESLCRSLITNGCVWKSTADTGTCYPSHTTGNSQLPAYCNLANGWEGLCNFINSEDPGLCFWVPNKLVSKCVAQNDTPEQAAQFCAINVHNEGGCRNYPQYCSWKHSAISP